MGRLRTGLSLIAAALLAAADVCAAPLTVSRRNMLQGCCPIKVLEYMAAGRPIVASRLPVVRELLSHEETALLCKPDRPRHLADAIRRFLDDPALGRRLGGEAARAARERFTWERHNDAVATSYAGLMR